MFSREFVLLQRPLMKNKAEFICSQIGGRQNIIETLLGQISVMSQLEVVNTVAANLISNLISLASVELIFNFHNTSIQFSPRSNGSAPLSEDWSVSQLSDLCFTDQTEVTELPFDPLDGIIFQTEKPQLIFRLCFLYLKSEFRIPPVAWNRFLIFHN